MVTSIVPCCDTPPSYQPGRWQLRGSALTHSTPLTGSNTSSRTNATISWPRSVPPSRPPGVVQSVLCHPVPGERFELSRSVSSRGVYATISATTQSPVGPRPVTNGRRRMVQTARAPAGQDRVPPPSSRLEWSRTVRSSCSAEVNSRTSSRTARRTWWSSTVSPTRLPNGRGSLAGKGLARSRSARRLPARSSQRCEQRSGDRRHRSGTFEQVALDPTPLRLVEQHGDDCRDHRIGDRLTGQGRQLTGQSVRPLALDALRHGTMAPRTPPGYHRRRPDLIHGRDTRPGARCVSYRQRVREATAPTRPGRSPLRDHADGPSRLRPSRAAPRWPVQGPFRRARCQPPARTGR